MHEGEIVEQGSTRQLLRYLQHPYGRALLAAADLEPKRSMRSGESSAVVLQARGHRSRISTQATLTVGTRRRPCGLSTAFHSAYTRERRWVWSVSRVPASPACCGLSWRSSGRRRARFGCWVRNSRRLPALTCVGCAARFKSYSRDPYGSFDPQWSVERLIAEPFFSAGFAAAGRRAPAQSCHPCSSKSACRQATAGAIRTSFRAVSANASPSPAP